MKTTKPAIIDMINQLHVLREQRKAMDKVENEIKSVLTSFMGDDLTLEGGNFMVIRENRSRKDLDKNAILENEGPEFIEKYSKTTEYQVLSVKPMKAGV